MTWTSLGSRLLGFVILLPLILGNFTVEEANLWLIFQAIVALQSMVDFGFTPTFIRIISYARSGKGGVEADSNVSDFWIGNEIAIPSVIGAMRSIYNRLAILAFALMAVVGSWAVMKPISLLEDTTIGWLAWVVIVASNSIIILGGRYGAYIQGINQIALYQRWQAVTGAVTICIAIFVLFVGGGLLHLVIIMQLGIIAGLIVSRRLAIKYAPEGAWSNPIIKNEKIMGNVWPAAWRSGLGVAMTYGTLQGTGIIYAQVASVADAAAFLLAQRIVRMLSSFANAPFYTRIPDMARMYADGDIEELIESARVGMLKANWVLLSGILVVGLVAETLLALIGSHTSFISIDVWLLLGLATLIERVGAMHLQLYSVTNDIVWHVANGVTGVILICVIPIAYIWLGMLGLPLGIFAGYLFFYTPYSVYKTYSKFSMSPLHMDGLSSLVPILLIGYVFWLCLISY